MLANVQKYDQLHDGHGEAHFTYFQLTWTSFKDGSWFVYAIFWGFFNDVIYEYICENKVVL